MSNLGTSGPYQLSAVPYQPSSGSNHIVPILVYWPIPVLSWPILEAELSSTTPYPPYQRFVLILQYWRTPASPGTQQAFPKS